MSACPQVDAIHPCKVDTLHDRVAKLELHAEKHTDAIHGNGQPGIKTRIEVVERRTADIVNLMQWVLGMVTLQTLAVIYELVR